MRLKSFVILGMVGAIVVVWTAAGMFPAAAHEGPVEISVPEGAQLRMDRVDFPHNVHAKRHGGEFECTVCHHQWDGKSEDEIRYCSSKGCHDLANPETPEEKRSVKYFRNAFHGGDTSCNGCHKARAKEGKTSGPTRCTECHKKK